MSKIIPFLFGWLMPLLKYLAPSICGTDGNTSGRKISALVFMFMILSTTSKILMKDSPTMIHIYLLAILVCTYLLLIGILTIQNIVDIMKNGGVGKGLTNGQPDTEKKDA